MDIHKPKPWHGWREFLKEYVIIVVGVLTALGGEQGVEWLHWRHQVGAARHALAADYQRILNWSAEREAVTPCIARRLAAVTAILDKASADRRLPPLGDLGVMPNRGWDVRSWESLVSSQTLAHIPHEDMLTFSQINLFVNSRQPLRDEEMRNWAILDGMAGPGRQFGDAEAAQLRAAVSISGIDASTMASGARWIPGLIRATHLLTEAQIAGAQKAGAETGATDSVCHPIGPPPSIGNGTVARLQAAFSPPDGRADVGNSPRAPKAEGR